MPTANGIIDDYQTIAVRRKRADRDALKRAITAIHAEMARTRSVQPIPATPPAIEQLVIDYAAAPQSRDAGEERVQQLRRLVHNLVDAILFPGVDRDDTPS